MATAELSGLQAKIRRADETLMALSSEIEVLLRSGYRAEGRFLADPPRYTFFAFGDSNVHPRFSVLAGEVVHQLRSTLDHLVTQLAVSGPGGGDPFALEFPICRSEASFKKALKRGKLGGVFDETIVRIEQMQPYNVATPVDDSTLLALHDLDRADKHRSLAVVVAAVQMTETLKVNARRDVDVTGMTPPTPSGTRPSRNGTPIFTIDFGDRFDPAIEVTGDFGFSIAFDQLGPAADVPVSAALSKMRNLVVTHVAQFFPSFAVVR